MESNSTDRIKLSVAEAQALGEETLVRAGYDAEEARIITDHVMDAALCGYEYSGLPKILNVVEHKRLKQPRRRIRAVYETPVSARMDGGNNNGMVAMYRAARVAIDKAREHGFAVVSVADSWTSGRSAYYVEMVAREGLVCIHTASTHNSVAPPGAMVGGIGTNPISFGFPTEKEPFVIDLGTSAFMGTDLQFRVRRREQIPEGVAIDKDGKPTRDPLQAKWLLSLAGHKGFALAMALKAMGVLAADTGDGSDAQGYVFIAFKPELLMPLEDYKRDMNIMLSGVKSVKKRPGVTDIRLPSENSFATRLRLRQHGIEIDRSIHDALKAVPAGKLPEQT